jgi:hypothetical protein
MGHPLNRRKDCGQWRQQMIGSIVIFVGGIIIGALASFFVVKNNLKKTLELFGKVDAYNADLDKRILALNDLLKQIKGLLTK